MALDISDHGKNINLVLLFCGERTGHFGAGSHISGLVDFFKESKEITMHMICTDDKYNKEMFRREQDGIKTLYIPQPENKLYLTTQQSRVQKTYAKHIVELIFPFVSDMENLVFWVNSIDYMNVSIELKRHLDCKIVYVHHAWTWKIYNNVPDGVFAEKWKTYQNGGLTKALVHYQRALEFTTYQQQMASLADHVVAVTYQAQSFFTEVLDIAGDKITTIYNGIDLKHNEKPDKEKLRNKYGISEGKRIVIFAGRIRQGKGLSFLLKAFEKAIRKHPELLLVIAGKGDFGVFIPLATSFCSRVIYTGEIDHQTLSEWYAIADIGVLPSLYEQCSFTAIEMRKHKLPMIVGGVDGLDEMFDHETDALKLNVRLDKDNNKVFDEAAFCDCLVRLVRNRRLAEKLIRNSYQKCLREFSDRIMQEKYLRVFRGLY